MVHKGALYHMIPGDALEAEAKRVLHGRDKSTFLELARKVKLFNEMYGETLTISEFLEAYPSNTHSGTEKNLG